MNEERALKVFDHDVERTHDKWNILFDLIGVKFLYSSNLTGLIFISSLVYTRVKML